MRKPLPAVAAAATLVSVVPTLVLFAVVRRWIVEGLTAGAVKR
ncbi:hypothetical protein [Nonomuraea candida]|nr:hypothetical protein [Nonomuraea candida]